MQVEEEYEELSSSRQRKSSLHALPPAALALGGLQGWPAGTHGKLGASSLLTLPYPNAITAAAPICPAPGLSRTRADTGLKPGRPEEARGVGRRARRLPPAAG